MELIRNEKVAVNTVELEFKVGKDVFEPAVTKAFRKANAEIRKRFIAAGIINDGYEACDHQSA